MKRGKKSILIKEVDGIEVQRIEKSNIKKAYLLSKELRSKLSDEDKKSTKFRIIQKLTK